MDTNKNHNILFLYPSIARAHIEEKYLSAFIRFWLHTPFSDCVWIENEKKSFLKINLFILAGECVVRMGLRGSRKQ